ncbi:MAG: GvpL/GvpF family gas vesicle protein [Solirubrobacteraceae bacterium]
MSVLLYAVSAARTLPPAATGLSGRQLRAIRNEDLVAIIACCDAAPPADTAHAWAYHEVVNRLMADGPLLPARFGSLAADEREIETMLIARRDEWHASLARIGDRVEYAVSAPAIDDEDAPDTGTGYMERLLSRERRDRQLEELAGPLVRDSRRTAHGIAYLVERDAGGAFVAHAGAAGLTAVGPWPPYSFASAA